MSEKHEPLRKHLTSYEITQGNYFDFLNKIEKKRIAEAVDAEGMTRVRWGGYASVLSGPVSTHSIIIAVSHVWAQTRQMRQHKKRRYLAL